MIPWKLIAFERHGERMAVDRRAEHVAATLLDSVVGSPPATPEVLAKGKDPQQKLVGPPVGMSRAEAGPEYPTAVMGDVDGPRVDSRGTGGLPPRPKGKSQSQGTAWKRARESNAPP